MANNSNFTNNLEHTLDELLADLKNHNFVDSFPAETNVQFNISVNDPDLVNLKTKIVDFLEQHPTIVNEIKKYFYEDLILYTLRRALNSSCTMHDITKTRATLIDNSLEHDDNDKQSEITDDDEHKQWPSDAIRFNNMKRIGI
ncbi:unnamed protein product [Rotaria socialis]|uniref:Uncharacterized protein n=1 Tax=Rotaria socialis TaxID=392032 RepID=A0A819AIQ4_9BILA|nr:unnamed protein product [Rotaria socialis]